MMTDDQVLAAYQMLKQLSQRMLSSTSRRDWEQLPPLQQELAALMAALQAGEGQAARPASVIAEKKALIEDILALRQAAMEIALPWRDSIAAMLDSAGSARRVAHAYGQGR